MQERLDVEDVRSSSSKESYSEAQKDENDDKNIDEKLTKKEKLAVRVRVEAILNNLCTDIDDAMKPFEVISSYDKSSAEDSSEENKRDSNAEDKH